MNMKVFECIYTHWHCAKLIINTFYNKILILQICVKFHRWSHHYFIIFTVSATPTFTLTRLGTCLNHVQLSWTGSSPEYEMFYSLSGSDNIQSLINTTDTTYSVTSGLMQNKTYEFLVVSYGNDGTPVLPSFNSSIESVTLSKW